ncbi:MAG: hypothetical protein KDA96_27185, partial [Planctomycetaceae bacterium]|nr:hypothetical protein [Planctomycetaceae bacterium]
MKQLILSLSLFAYLWIIPCRGADAQERTAVRLLPADSIAYVELSDPNAALTVILDHPLRSTIESLEVFQQATQSQPYRNFLTGRKTFELLMGMEWREAVEALTQGGIYVAAVPESQGVILLVQGRDDETMETFRTKILELARLSAPESKRDREYRGVPLYEVNKVGVGVVGRWLVATNAPNAGRTVLDRLLDGPDEDSLATTAPFQAAQKLRESDATAWG